MDKTIYAVIVDDEKMGRDLLKALLLEYCYNVRVVGKAGNVDEAYKLINEAKPDLVFLDIEMPGGTGFDLLEKFDVIDFSVIFVTSFDKYAIKAIKFSAVDYLLKPVNEDELIKAVEKVSKLAERPQKNSIDNLINNYKNIISGNNKLSLSTKDGIIFLEVTDITRCKADGKYTWVYLKDGKEILATKNLGEFEDFLSEHNFIRVHHAHLVNMNYIKTYKQGRSGIIMMMDGTEVDVSQRKKEEFLKRLNKI